jgi:hypothetical protein
VNKGRRGEELRYFLILLHIRVVVGSSTFFILLSTFVIELIKNVEC